MSSPQLLHVFLVSFVVGLALWVSLFAMFRRADRREYVEDRAF
jgi:hypothetical protein